ncbi:hypothetical protein FRB98_008145, partial [Tulasnella sp. 332]
VADVQPAGAGGSLPITFSFTFTGTEFNVVGNDWRDGLVTFTLDGEAQAPYDLGLATNSTEGRCRFPWYSHSGLSAKEHTFTFNLTAPSPSVLQDDGSQAPGDSVYYGVQFFYYSYTPVSSSSKSSSTSTAKGSGASGTTRSQATRHDSKAAAIGASLWVGVAALIALM